MHTLTRLVAPENAAPASAALTLSYDLRRKARLRTVLDNGVEVAVLLPRGLLLREGDRLSSEDGTLVVRVRASKERLSLATTPDPLLLARAAYHLGNRHVALQIEPRRLSYQHDHVLDDLARELGLTVTCVEGPFEPEAGGYSSPSNHHHDHHDHGDRDGHHSRDRVKHG